MSERALITRPEPSRPTWARLVLPLLLATCTAAAHADRLLTLSARGRIEGAVAIGEVLACEQVVIRLRSEKGSVLQRAEAAAEALAKAAATGLQRPDLTTETVGEGQSVLKAGAETVVLADNETARLAGMTPTALAASWATTVKAALKEPYLALNGTDTVLVPVEEARYVRYGGPLGKTLTATSDAEDIALVKLEPEIRRIKLYGVAPGMTLATLKSGKAELLLGIDCRWWAARIAPTAVAELTGSGQDGHLARKVAINAALCAATPRPGATLSVTSVEREESRFRVGVLATGDGLIPAKRNVEVDLQWAVAPRAEPGHLMVSNEPERIRALGSLMREPLTAARPTRLLYHHVNSTGKRILFVVRLSNPSRRPAAAHIILGEAGPGHDELGVGHAAAARFLSQRSTGSGYVLHIPPASAADIVREPASPETILSGLARIVPVSPDTPLFVEVLAVSPGAGIAGMWVEPVAPEDYAEPKTTAFTFGAKKTVELTHEVGGAWTFYGLGKDGSTNEAGTYLAGDYGVEHHVTITITNPTQHHGRAEIAARAGGGVMRGLFRIDGALRETGVLAGTQQETLTRRSIPPGRTVNVRIVTMPESASNYPVQIVVSSITKD